MLSLKNNKVNTKQLITSVIITTICGVVFVVIIPIIALFMLDVFVTFVSLFDPLHKGKNIEEAWGSFIGITIVQIIFPTLASIATGLVISFLTQFYKSGVVYLIGTAISVFIYIVFQAISISFVGIFASELIVVTWLFVSLVIVGFFSIIIGLICVGVNRKML